MNKNCELRHVLITHTNRARHLKSQAHPKNDPDQTIKTGRCVMTKRRKCKLCNVLTTHKNWSRHLKSQTHLQNDPDQTINPRIRTIVRKKEEAFKSRLSTLEIENSRNFIDVKHFLNSVKNNVTRNIRKKLEEQKNLKVNSSY